MEGQNQFYMLKYNKHTTKYNITEQNLIGFDEVIASIPNNIKKSMVLYITTWQEKPDNPQEPDTMTTKPEWFKKFEDEQNKRWEGQRKFNEEQRKFNEMQEKRWEKQEKFNEVQEKCWEEQHKFNKEQRKFNERILSLVEKIIKRIDNLVVKNNLKE